MHDSIENGAFRRPFVTVLALSRTYRTHLLVSHQVDYVLCFALAFVSSAQGPVIRSGG